MSADDARDLECRSLLGPELRGVGGRLRASLNAVALRAGVAPVVEYVRRRTLCLRRGCVDGVAAAGRPGEHLRRRVALAVNHYGQSCRDGRDCRFSGRWWWLPLSEMDH